jgi:hypothetical protein
MTWTHKPWFTSQVDYHSAYLGFFLQLLVAGFEPANLGLWAGCSAIVLPENN